MRSAEKVLVIGLDGATFDIIKPLIANGELPTLRRLMEEGSYGNLKSVPNMSSPAAWPSFATGKNPGKHGSFWMVDRKPGTYEIEPQNGNAWQGRAAPIWEILGQSGKRVGVVNVPMTYPARAVNGFLLAGFDCPSINSPGFSYPASLVKEIVKNCGDYVITSQAANLAKEGKIADAVEALHNQIDIRLKATKYLLRTFPWDFFVVVFMATDIAHHIFWHLHDPSHPAHDPDLTEKHGDPIIEIYRKLDSALDEILKEVNDDVTVIVMSDHGAAINPGGHGFLNQWLEAEGFLHRLEPSILGRLAIASRYAVLYGATWLIRSIESIFGERMVRVLRKRAPGFRLRMQDKILISRIDWSSTKAYWDGGGHYIRINLAGREPQGIVQPGREYEEIRDAIIEKLSECRDPVTGRLVVERVAKREDIYHGPYVDKAPDIEIVWKADGVVHGLTPSEHTKEGALEKVETSLWATPGGHSMYGILIMKGKHIKRGVEIRGAEIIDLAPTVLYLMGLGIPSDMDGKVLKEAIVPSFLKTNPIQYTEPLPQGPSQGTGGLYSEREKRELEDRLRALGYIE